MCTLIDGCMDGYVGSCMDAWVNKWKINPSTWHTISDSLGLWYAIQQIQAVQVGSQTCWGLRTFLARGCYVELARCFLHHPSGNLGIWLKLWYFVLFLFLVLTPRLLFFLSMSASTDASWPIGSVNPFQPAPGWLCQYSILLGFAMNPHGSLPHDVYAIIPPLTQPGSFRHIKIHQKSWD